MKQRSAWKQYAAALGHEDMRGRKARDYPQTSAALDLWARRNAVGNWRYSSPEMAIAELGTRTNRPHVGIVEIEERMDAAVKALPNELRDVIRVHHEHAYRVGERKIPFAHGLPVAVRAKRAGWGKDRYYDLLTAAYFHLAGKLGFDGR